MVTVYSLIAPSGVQVNTPSPPGRSGLKEKIFFFPSNAGFVVKICGFFCWTELMISKIRRFARISGTISKKVEEVQCRSSGVRRLTDPLD